MLTENIFTEIEQRCEHLGEICDYVVVDNLLCLSCYVKTDAPYFLVCDNGKIIYKDYDENNYLSNLNKEGYGNGLVIMDLKSLQIIKTFCFKDSLNWDFPLNIGFSCRDFLIIGYQESSYIFYLNDFSFLEFGGFDYKVCDPYIINFPDGGYDKFYDFSLIDTTTREIVNLSRFLPADDGVLDKPFDPSKENVFISHGKLICIKENEAFGEKEYSIPIEMLFGRKFTMILDEGVCKREIYDIKLINEIEPVVGYSLGEYRYNNEYADWREIEYDSSYISKLLHSIKYKFRKDKIDELAHVVAKSIKLLGLSDVDVIIPVPCSDKNRPFQPLYEIVKSISNITNIPYDLEYLLSSDKKPIKTVQDAFKRKRILDQALYITNDNKYADKKILLIDDHIYRGDSIRTSISKCKCNDIFVIAITRNVEVGYLP